MLKKFLRNFLLCALLLTQSACLTKYLWGDDVYNENVSQFLIGEDGRYVVLIGEKYHYVLIDGSGLFYKILGLKQNNTLTVNPKKSHLKLDQNNEIRGYLTIEGPFGVLPIEDVGLLTSLGIKPDRRDNVSIKINLSGRRYAAKYLGQTLTNSSSIYRIPISYDGDSNFVKDIGKAAITPIAVGLDAVFLIGKVVVSPMTK